MRISKCMYSFITAAAAALCLTACGHNIGTAVHGKFVNVGYDPELNKVGIQYVDGIIVTGLQKELSKTGLKYSDTVSDADGRTTTTSMEYNTENGAQVTGYAVELAKAQAGANQKESAPAEPETAE